MTAGEVAEQIRALRAETVAAIEQRDLLGANARRAVIAALRDGLICRCGADDALRGWGLEPLPGWWTVSAEGLLSYTRWHIDEAETRRRAAGHLPDKMYLLRLWAWIDPVRPVEVALVGGEDDYPESHLYKITARVILRAAVKATTKAGAVSSAEAKLASHLAELEQAGITLTGLTWTVIGGPDDVPLSGIDADALSATGAIRLPDLGDDLATVTAARDQAVDALAALQEKIRQRAISALIDGALGDVHEFELTAARVEGFLLDLGLAGLPRAHHTTVVATLKVRVRAGTAGQARTAVRDAVQALTTGPDGFRPWIGRGWAAADVPELGGGCWQVTWWRVCEVWLRGHTDPAAATAAAEALVREDMTRALAGVDYDALTLTSTDEGYGVDHLLDPDAD